MVRRHGGRRIERSALTALVPVAILIPFWLIALAAIWLIVRLFADLAYWTIPIGWLAIGVILFIPTIQVNVLSLLLGARRLHTSEYDAIIPSWTTLIRTTGFAPDRFEIRIIDSDELNAFACGGRLVVVTTFALHRLTRHQLSGVLAHELSHHLGFHTVALTLSHWLSIPIVILARIGFFLRNVARAATDAFVSNSRALTIIGRAISRTLWALSWVFLAAIVAVDAISNLVGHRSEYDADQRAVELGYGPPLAAALRVVMRHGGGTRPVGWRARLAASHPPARTRVARIEAVLRQRRRSRRR